MTDDERLDFLERNAKSPELGQEKEAETLLWLIALARIGTAVQPRPIPSEGKIVWNEWPDKYYYQINGATLICFANPNMEPLCTYDLSALPKPKDTP